MKTPWLRWKERREAQGKPTDKPNFIISTGYQVVWEKFADLWQIEMRTVPLTLDNITLDPKQVIELCDENTICVVPIQGVTWTGLNDDVEALDAALDEYNARTGYDIPIHVDAASGGMIAPFIQPELEWDFQISRVHSISTSGHKYGLVYPGLGWVIWRERQWLPEDLIFYVSYLGGDMPTFALNFSRPGAQVVLQFYMFLRLGFEGYKKVQQACQDVALYLSHGISEIGPFELWNDGSDIPVFAWRLKEGHTDRWTLYNLADRLRTKGWLVPAYPMPDNLGNLTVERIVVRNGLSMDLAGRLLKDIQDETAYLENLSAPMPVEQQHPGFHH